MNGYVVARRKILTAQRVARSFWESTEQRLFQEDRAKGFKGLMPEWKATYENLLRVDRLVGGCPYTILQLIDRGWGKALEAGGIKHKPRRRRAGHQPQQETP